MKKFVLGVSDFAIPAPLRGSIDTLSGLGRGPIIGVELHQKIQSERQQDFPTYQREVKISHQFEHKEFIFEITGRMDGIFEEDSPKIEEIKSHFNVYELYRRLKDSQNEHPYILQLQTYGYFYWLINKKLPKLSMCLVSTRNAETVDLEVSMHLKSYEEWLLRRLDELVLEAKNAEKKIKRRKKAAKALIFPFPQPRQGQIKLIQTIEEGMKEKRPMMIQAPTGLGKTVGVLFPTLREALSRGQKALYLTPKNSQHGVAEDAIERLQENGTSVRSMTLTAKSKMCFKNEPICNPDYCEYARDHYTKVAENNLLEVLSKKRNLSARVFKKIAEQNQVCPFELQLDATRDVDTVICDYNYVFSPNASLGRLSNTGFFEQSKPNLIIDEAHNLPSRAMDYFSPAISVTVLQKMRDDARGLPRAFQKKAEDLIDGCISVVEACAPLNCQKPSKIEAPTEKFLEQDFKLRTFLSTYLKADIEIQPKDVVMRLCFYWSEFTGTLEFISHGRKEFFTTYQPYPATVKITCCDASEMLRDCYKDFEQVVAFSATLKPFEFYQQLAGLENKNVRTAEFVSPFPKNKRKLLVIPQISSKFSERQRNYPRIAEAIQKIIALKQGNYFAFFPSFEFLENVFRLFLPPTGFRVIKQERSMRREEIEKVLAALAEEDTSKIVFAVQGGVFSEGVDYPGKMLIGAFIVGPPLPSFDLEREKMREYYDEHYSYGFDYAYTYPAMAKAIQAAGRVIRSENDSGLIVLMDNRFIQASFAKSMPEDWFENTAQELVSSQILHDVSEFWKSLED